MKFLSKFTFLVLALGLTVAFSSCSKDDDSDDTYCATCDAFEDSTGASFPAINVCEGDDDGSGGELTAAQIDVLVTGYETAGYTCDQ